ncbi:MAG TPA: hypothetical protein VJL58_10395 [Pyrinomonadaceae bacterium]|nr:hypothetical protein [Pyrinomonadaceae bacterium]
MKTYLLLILSILGIVSTVDAQRRDYMTESEVELVRDHQDIDKRIEVLIRMIDRRLDLVTITRPLATDKRLDKLEWGPEPQGTRLQLLTDVKYLLQKAIDDIDNVSEHNKNSLEQNKTEGLLFPKSVRILAAAATRYLGPLKAESERTKDEKERGVLLQSIESCELITESVKQLPPEVKKVKN